MENSEEKDYIERIKEGDSSSYAYLVNRYKDIAYTIALRMLNITEDAEDVVQESFIKAYQQLHKFEGKSKFSTWLYTIVYRTAISKSKENRIDTFSINEAITSEKIHDHSISQHEILEKEDEQKYVKQAILRLPKIDALIITLYYLEESSIREISEITGLSVATIKIRLFRARKKLERELQFLITNKTNASNNG